MLEAGADTLGTFDTPAPNCGLPAEGTAAGLKNALQRVIEAATKDEATELLDRIWTTEGLAVRVAPHLAMVMCTVADPFDCAFHLGEVLITHTRVECDGHPGCGQILGDEPEKALLLASVEAITAARGNEGLGQLPEFIHCLEQRHCERRRQERQLAAATAVRFESMKKESVDFGSLGQ